MTEGSIRTITLVLVALILSAGSFLICYYALNLGTWSWLIGLLVLLICLIIFLPQIRVKREKGVRRETADEEGFIKKERVFNRTISKPSAGPLWESRIYQLSSGDNMKVDVTGDHEITTRLVKIGPDHSRTDVNSSNGPSKRWSSIFEVHEDGDYQAVLESGHPKVTVTVKIGYRPNR